MSKASKITKGGGDDSQTAATHQARSAGQPHTTRLAQATDPRLPLAQRPRGDDRHVGGVRGVRGSLEV